MPVFCYISANVLCLCPPLSLLLVLFQLLSCYCSYLEFQWPLAFFEMQSQKKNIEFIELLLFFNTWEAVAS